MQFGVLRHPALYEYCSRSRINTGGEPVHNRVVSELVDVFSVFVVSGQRMVVGDKEVTLVFVLQSHPVVQNAVQVAKV